MANLFTGQELSNIIGSWHNRGFHGHSRSKSRIEFSNLYRQSAKPRPPTQFRERQRDNAFSHVFSKHDNKQIFLNDPMLFGSGSYGKKKIDSVNKSKWKPDFVSWNDSTLIKKSSVYQNDFCQMDNINNNNTNSNGSMFSNYSNATASSKLLSSRQNLDTRPVSVYAYNFNHNEPKRETSLETQNETYLRFISKNTQRSKSCVAVNKGRHYNERNNVANCMVWHDKIESPPQVQQTLQIPDMTVPPVQASYNDE